MNTNNQEPEKITLQSPDFKKEHFIGYKCGLRPFRKGGVNLSEEQINGKIIFHNYGHGGAGVSVCYGYALLQFLKFNSKYQKETNNDIAVIGGGIIGLFTALIFRDNGYQVTIYAQQYVQKDIGQILKGVAENNIIASQIAAGIWMPDGYEFNQSEHQWEKHDFASRSTYSFYDNAIQNNRYRGLKKQRCILLGDASQMYQCLPTNIIRDTKKVSVTWGNGEYFNATSYTSILIDTTLFMHELMSECINKGVKIQNEYFQNLQQITQLPQKFIFNCTGTGSAKLFNDTNIQPVKGQLAVFKSNYKIDYYLVAENDVRIYPTEFGFCVGKVTLKDSWDNKLDEKLGEQMVFNAKQFFSDKITKPNL